MAQRKRIVAVALVVCLLLTLLPNLALAVGVSDPSNLTLTFDVGDGPAKAKKIVFTASGTSSATFGGTLSSSFQITSDAAGASPTTVTAGGTYYVAPKAALTAPGEATLAITDQSSPTSPKTIKIVVTKPFVAVTGVTLNNSTAQVGTDFVLSGKIEPSTANAQTISKWEVTDKGTTGAVLGSDGKTLTFSSKGTVKVKATVAGGATIDTPFVSSDLTITVQDAPIVLTPPSITTDSAITIKAGESLKLAATGSDTITWSSSNMPSGVTLDSDGTVTVGASVAKGEYKFTAVATNGTAPDATKDFVLTVTVDETPQTPALNSDLETKIDDLLSNTSITNDPVSNKNTIENLLTEVQNATTVDKLVDNAEDLDKVAQLEALAAKANNGEIKIEPTQAVKQEIGTPQAVGLIGFIDNSDGAGDTARLAFDTPAQNLTPSAEQINNFNSQFGTDIMLPLDISLYITENGGTEEKKEDAGRDIGISINKPTKFGDKKVAILHYHGGIGSTPNVITPTDLNGKLSFRTKLFSTFVLVVDNRVATSTGDSDTPTPIVPILYDITKSGDTFNFKTFIANGSGKMLGATVTVKLNNKYSTVVTIGNDGVGTGTLEAAGFAGSVANFSARVNGISSATVTKPMIVSSSGKVMPR